MMTFNNIVLDDGYAFMVRDETLHIVNMSPQDMFISVCGTSRLDEVEFNKKYTICPACIRDYSNHSGKIQFD
jgi:hypothetical protein